MFVSVLNLGIPGLELISIYFIYSNREVGEQLRAPN